MPNCSKCGKVLTLNERLSKSMSVALGMDQLKVYFCSQCVDNLYVEFEGALYSSEEWRKRREELKR